MDIFRQVKASFTNFDAYREFAVQRSGTTFKYFILLFTLIFFIGSTRFVYDFSIENSRIADAMRDKIPEFRLDNGHLTVDGQQPVVIEGEKNTVLLIDTTGPVNETVLDKYSEGVFISTDRVIIKQDIQTRIIPFAAFGDVKFSKQDLVNFLPKLKWLPVVFVFFGYWFKMAWVLMTTVILALAGLLVNRGLKNRLRFSNNWNIAVYALTLPWLLEMTVKLVYPAVPLFWPIKWGMAGYFFYKGMEAASTVGIDDPPRPPGRIVI